MTDAFPESSTRYALESWTFEAESFLHPRMPMDVSLRKQQSNLEMLHHKRVQHCRCRCIGKPDDMVMMVP